MIANDMFRNNVKQVNVLRLLLVIMVAVAVVVVGFSTRWAREKSPPFLERAVSTVRQIMPRLLGWLLVRRTFDLRGGSEGGAKEKSPSQPMASPAAPCCTSREQTEEGAGGGGILRRGSSSGGEGNQGPQVRGKDALLPKDSGAGAGAGTAAAATAAAAAAAAVAAADHSAGAGSTPTALTTH